MSNSKVSSGWGLLKTLKNVFIFMVTLRLTRHNKRILFVTSLYYKLANLESVDKETLEQLNDVLQVTDDVKAMTFPALIHNLIWDESITETFQTIMNNHKQNVADFSDVIAEILKDIPENLRYGRREDMSNDLKDLLPMVFARQLQPSAH